MNQNNFKFAPSTTKCVLIELQVLYHFYLYLPYLLMVIDIPARKSRMLEANDVRSQRDQLSTQADCVSNGSLRVHLDLPTPLPSNREQLQKL